MTLKTINFDDFVKLAKFCYNLNGIVPYDDVRQQPTELSKNNSITKLLKHTTLQYLREIFSFIILVNMNFVLLTEGAFVVVNFMENADFLQAARNLCFMGFVVVSVLKFFSNKRQRPRLNILMRNLYELYPKEAANQPDYELQRHLDQYKRFSFLFVFLYGFTVWAYNSLPWINYLYYEHWLQQGTWQRTLPYYCWLPFEWRDNWIYYVLYVSQAAAAHTCCASYVASDLMMCTTAVQLIMHFRKLAHSIERQKPVQGDERRFRKDLRALSDIVAYHNRTLTLCPLLNEIFGVPTLINFISTSFVMCFLAFQFIVGVPLDAMIMLIFYMVCSVEQIFMISTYGQELMTTSEHVGHSAYNHNWMDADIRYKKMLVVIIQRAQQPAVLKATIFVDVSMATLTDLLQLSYKFLAVIRTMYVR